MGNAIIDQPVKVKGTGLVDCLTVSGARLDWSDSTKRFFYSRLYLEGDLVAVIDGLNYPAEKFVIPSAAFTINGNATYSANLGNETKYIMSVAGIKRYLEHQFVIKTNGGYSTWDEIMAAAKEGKRLVIGARGEINVYSGKEKIAGEKTITNLAREVAPYWNRPLEELVVLDSVKEMELSPRKTNTVGIELEGEVSISPGSYTHFEVNGKTKAAVNLRIAGKGKGSIIVPSFSFPNQATVYADYAFIGTGPLDIYRNERDGQQMHINSVTSEELTDAVISVQSAAALPYAHGAADAKSRRDKIRLAKRVIQYGSVPLVVAALGVDIIYSVSSLLIPVASVVSLGSLFAVGAAYDFTNRKLRKSEAQFLDEISGLRLGFTGVQTSKWLLSNPQYLDPSL